MGKIFPQESHAPETCGKAWSSGGLSLAEEDQVSKHFKNWDLHMSMASDGDALLRPEETGPCNCEVHF